jgi:hypothetical protein
MSQGSVTPGGFPLSDVAGERLGCRPAVGGQDAQPAVVAPGMPHGAVLVGVVPLLVHKDVAGPAGDNARRRCVSKLGPLTVRWAVDDNALSDYPGIAQPAHPKRALASATGAIS